MSSSTASDYSNPQAIDYQMEDRSNQELTSAVLAGDLSPRKEAIAKEVLRRRYESEGGRWLGRYVWLPLIGIVALARTSVRRFQGRSQFES